MKKYFLPVVLFLVITQFAFAGQPEWSKTSNLEKSDKGFRRLINSSGVMYHRYMTGQVIEKVR